MYSRELVETLIPALWDGHYAYGLPKPDSMPDPDMPRGWTNPKEGNKHFAYIADIKSAWAGAPLSPDERRALILRYGMDMTEDMVGHFLGSPRTTIQYRLYKGVGKLVAHLNGGEFVESFNEDEVAA